MTIIMIFLKRLPRLVFERILYRLENMFRDIVPHAGRREREREKKVSSMRPLLKQVQFYPISQTVRSID